MATYIFDFDGTLVDSFSLVCDIILTKANYLGCRQLKAEDAEHLKELHAREVLKYLGIPFWRTASFVRKMRKLGHERSNEIQIFPEWAGILQKIKDNSHKMGIITSNSQETVAAVLKKYEIYDYFDFIFCDKSLFGKKRCLKKLIDKQGLSSGNTYYVGDEVRDIEAAQLNKIQAIAVSWGFNSSARLKLANPDKLFLNFEQLNESILV